MKKEEGESMPQTTCREDCYNSAQVAEVFAQTAGRYNDQSAFANNQSQLLFLNLNSQYNTHAVKRLDQGTYPFVPGFGTPPTT